MDKTCTSGTGYAIACDNIFNSNCRLTSAGCQREGGERDNTYIFYDGLPLTYAVCQREGDEEGDESIQNYFPFTKIDLCTSVHCGGEATQSEYHASSQLRATKLIYFIWACTLARNIWTKRLFV